MKRNPLSSPKRVISVFMLTMLNVSIMASLRNLPFIAEYGLGSLLYFLAAALFFLLPQAFVSAELATGWQKGGGIYIWVREALGDRWGFFAVWMQWAHNLSWYPVILSFAATMIGFALCPDLIHHKVYIVTLILGLFWFMTFLNYFGIKTSTWFSTIGVILGTILPGVVIIALGINWFLSEESSHFHLSLSSLTPEWKGVESLVFLSGLFLSFAGLEVSSAHAAEVKNPQKNYPFSIILAALITFSLVILGALSIAIVIPKEKINIVAGLMDSFSLFFAHYKISFLIPITALLLVFGAIAEVNAWIIGPIKGLLATAEHGNLPPLFQKKNRRNAPTALLLFQGVIVTLVSCVFLFMPTISSSFWILSILSSQIYLSMYALMFISAVRLRYTKPHVDRAYKIPYQHHGMWVAALMGLLGSIFAFFIGFFPPTFLEVGDLFFYRSFLAIGNLILAAIPLVIYHCRKPHWASTKS